MLSKKRGQSSLEYAIFIGVVAAAVAFMSLYFRRSIQSVVKVAADELGTQKKGVTEYYFLRERKAGGYSASETSSDVMRSTTEQEWRSGNVWISGERHKDNLYGAGRIL